MALKNVIDPATATSRLQEWLVAQMPDADDVTVSDMQVPSSSGMSSETVLFEATYRRDGEQTTEGMVARVAPQGEGIFPEYDLRREGTVISTVNETTDV